MGVFMEDKKRKYKRKNSSVKSRKKIQRSTLSNEELLDSILNKKKKGKKETNKEIELPVLNEQNVVKRLKEINNSLKKKSITNDDLYDLLQERKKLNKELNRIRKEKREKNKLLEETINDIKEENLIIEIPKSDKDELKEITHKKKEEVFEVLTLEDASLKKNKRIIILLLFVLLFVGFFTGSIIYKTSSKDSFAEDVVSNNNSMEEKQEDNKEELSNAYNECIKRAVDESDKTEEIVNLEKELQTFLNKYKVSVGYNDLDTGYSFYYNSNQVYYAASTIKILAVYYLYNEAYKGNIDLDSTIKYKSSDKWSSSPAMSKIKVNTNVSLRDLCKYASTVSDNTAYQMLVKYIGRSKLVSFGKSLGAKYTLVGGDNFGSLDVNDALIYMRSIYNYINDAGDLGQELKNYMISAEQNGLSLDDYGIQAAHKYGEYSPNYHDYGIVYSKHPYIVAILTGEYGKSMISNIKNINEKVYQLHLSYYQNREKICHLEVYGS